MLPELIYNPANRDLGGFMHNGASFNSFRGGGRRNGDEGNIVPFHTENEIAESAQNYCCGY